MEKIRIEEERAEQVINVTLQGAEAISAYQLAIGKLNFIRATASIATSASATVYLDTSLSTTASAKATVKGSVNPIDCILGGCTAEGEASVETAFNVTIGLRFELSTVASTEAVFDPNALQIAHFESLGILKEAERDAAIEGANSAAEVKNLLLEQTELLIEEEIAWSEFNKVVAEHNLLVDQYLF